MSVSPGPFITCFLGTMFLSGYLYVILYRLNCPFIYGAKIIFAGIAIIFIRMCIPVNLPFTYTIYSTKILLPIAKIFYAPLGTSDYRLFDVLVLCWIVVSILKLGKVCVTAIRLNHYLSAYTVTEDGRYSKLFASVGRYCSKSIRIAVIPHKVSPAISGLLHPTMIFPECFDRFTEEELDYICMHEINHYRNHDLWMKMLLNILACVHWWNPLIYLLKREYSLTLELINDYFLMQNHPRYNGTCYADLILKTAELSGNSLPKYSTVLAPFIRKRDSDLNIRVRFALENPSHQMLNNKQLRVHVIVIFAVMIFSFVFVTDFTTRTPSCVIEDTYEVNSSNTYFIHTSEGYEVYINGKYISTITELPEDFKNFKIYEQGL